MNIKLNSRQLVDATNLSVGLNTVIDWVEKGYIKGTRNESVGKRGGNYEYDMAEVKRIKQAIRKFGAKNLPKCLKDDYVPKPKEAKVKESKSGVVLTAAPDPTLKAILAELKAIRSMTEELYQLWKPTS